MQNLAKELEADFQAALTKGWKEFVGSREEKLLAKFYDALVNGFDFYRSGFREEIPFPAYQYAAELVCRHLFEVACRHRVFLLHGIPGIERFFQSQETEAGGKEPDARIFPMEVKQADGAVLRFDISFFHLHDSFGFPKSPQIVFRGVDVPRHRSP